MVQRFKITIEYDGGGYVGWQAQDNGPSVQEAVEQAIHAFSGERVRLTAAGRTDSGVHALGQVVHFDLEKKITSHQVMAAANAHLKGAKVAVIKAEAVDENFNARFSAARRHYLYRILNRKAPPVLDHGKVWHVPQKLDAEKMHAAAQTLVGKHDFTTFRSIRCQAKSPVKTLDRLDVERSGEEILFRVSARSFLHHQVRSMVGTLKLVGLGKWTADNVTEALEARDRTAVGFNAPPHGLYLIRVEYREGQTPA
ncbi:MAG: tRNA pseudouridine(38-40) synthase TruA [Proteobacteria bacterium]|nr:tRNA pseudouridine(38-40) synthase TruA [Pseudomonadota bacterium]